MMSHQGGKIINIGSMYSFFGGTAVCANVPEIVLAGERASGCLEVERVDFLRPNVAQ
jgi:hypothetical protein